MIIYGSHTTPSWRIFRHNLANKFIHVIFGNINQFIVMFQDKNKAEMVITFLEINK